MQPVLSGSPATGSPHTANDSANTVWTKLQLVVQTGLLLAKSIDLKCLVQAATDAGLRLCGADLGAFFYNVSDASGESYQLYTLSGVAPDRFANFPMPRNTAIFGPTFQGEHIVRSADILKDPRYGKSAPYFGMPPGHPPVRSYLAISVKAQNGEVLGGLFYGHAEPDRFHQEHEDLVSTVAAQAAVAIENFRLREQLTRKMEALELAESRNRDTVRYMAELAAIVESSDDAIISKDLNGIIKSWNHAASRIFGFTREEIVGQSILKLIPPDLQSEETMILSNIRAGKRVDHYETVRLRKDGERLDVLISISPIRDASGTIVGASKILRDVSERKQMERTILQAEKIAASGRMAATIAHEINNPLEAIVNLLFLARTSVDDPAQVVPLLDAAEGEVARLSAIARQTLGFYRENTSATPASISELVSEAIELYQPKCAAAGIRIERSLPSVLPIVLRKGEIMQVISNLIANAIYAMPSGGVLTLVVAESKPSESFRSDGVQISITDNGVGIAPENLPKIFDAFFSTRGSIGTGIGLFVVKQFIEGHGGTISVQSSQAPEHHGTTMSIFLPRENPYTQSVSLGS